MRKLVRPGRHRLRRPKPKNTTDEQDDIFEEFLGVIIGPAPDDEARPLDGSVE